VGFMGPSVEVWFVIDAADHSKNANWLRFRFPSAANSPTIFAGRQQELKGGAPRRETNNPHLKPAGYFSYRLSP